MALAVIRVAPVKASALGAMSSHHERTASKADDHIDPSRSHLNQQLVGSGDPRADVLALASQYKMGKTIDDPVLAAEIIMTASQDYFDRDFSQWRERPDVLKPWINAQIDFLKDNQPNVGKAVSVTLHLDESAPHLHVVTVPVTDVRVKNRYSDRTEQRLSYTKIFGDDKATLAEARRTCTTATATKLGRLQTAYADAMRGHGLDLERGVSNTGRKHISPQEYRDTIARGTPEPTPPLPNIPKPKIDSPMRAGMELMRKGKDATVIKDYEKAATNFRKVAILRGEDIAERDKRISALETELMIANIDNKNLLQQVKTLTQIQQETAEALRSNKELLKEYRGLSEYEIKKHGVGTQQEIDSFKEQSGRTKFNAIDFVMYKENCNISTAIYTLAERFPPEEIAKDAARRKADELVPAAFAKADEDKKTVKNALSTLENKPELEIKNTGLTKSNKAKADIINRQLNAIGENTRYRVTLMSTDKDKPTFNMGKGKGEDGGEKFYTQQELIELIPTLSYRNAKGYNVFITPIPNEKDRFILLDDIRDTEKAREFEPCLVLQTSPNSRQAVYKVAGDTDEAAAREFFNRINKDNGDPSISGLIHPMRLAGFTNRKAKYEQNGQYPFVSIVSAQDTKSEKAEAEIRTITRDHDPDMTPMPTPLKKLAVFKKQKTPDMPIRTQDIDIPNMRNWYQQQMDYWQDKTDLSKIDRRLAVYLAEQSFSEKQTQAIILSCSPDIQGRHGHELNKYLSGKTNGLDFALDVPEEHQQEELDKVHEDTNATVKAEHELSDDFEMEM